jgi:hypothetical protein
MHHLLVHTSLLSSCSLTPDTQTEEAIGSVVEKARVDVKARLDSSVEIVAIILTNYGLQTRCCGVGAALAQQQ